MMSNLELIVCAAIGAMAFYATAHLIVGIVLRIGKSPEYHYKLLPTAAIATLLNGWTVYFIGFSMVGNDASVFSVLVRSFLASISMFVGGSFFQELDGMTSHGVYMFLLAFLQVVALLITAIFAVRMLSKRFESYIRTFNYTLFPRKKTLNVFIGLNPYTIGFLQSMPLAGKKKDHNVIVDLPTEGSQESFTVSLETIFGFFPYKMEYIKLLKGVKYVLMNADKDPALLTSAPNENILDQIDLGDLRTLVYCHEKIRVYFFDSDNEGNIKAATQLMADKVFAEKKLEVYVSADGSEENLIVADNKGWSLVDPATLAIRMLRTDPQAQPVKYLPRSAEEKDSAIVREPFEALVVGFGHTGREALSFLYETAAFPDASRRRTPFLCHIVDYEIEARKEDWCRRSRATMQDRIHFEPLNDRCDGYWEWLSSIISKLNYIVVATGNDEENIRIAVSLLRLYLQETGGKGKALPGIYICLRAPQSSHMLDAIASGYGDYGKMLHAFGGNAQIYSYDNIIIDRALQGGLMFNNAYNSLSARLEGNTVSPEQQKPALNELYAHRSAAQQNLRNFLHGLTKLQLIGLGEEDVRQALTLRHKGQPLDTDQERIVKLVDDVIGYAQAHDGKYPTNPSDDSVETLICNVAICEHLRWNAAMELQGYTYGTEKDHLRRTHPCLTDWDNLTYEKQAYDFLALETIFHMIVNDVEQTR